MSLAKGSNKRMKRIALFPGSFDPITCGHTEIVQRGLAIFDEVFIGIGVNTTKTPTFPTGKKVQWISEIFQGEARVKVGIFSGLTVNFALSIEATFILRGLRAAPDFEYEKNIELLNKHLAPNIDTVYLVSSSTTGHISSSLVREVLRFNGNLKGLVPDIILQEISQQKI